MSEQTQITVRRMTSYPDRLRSYKVKVGGEVLGKLWARESLTVPVSPGRHSLVLRIDWCGSEPIDFNLQPGEHALFECGSNMTVWNVLWLSVYYVFFRPRQYLWLRREVAPLATVPSGQ
jgi:hypothetical protein